MQVLRFASIYKMAAMTAANHSNLHRWAAGIVNQAFKQVMGRFPTPAERQIVMAVSDLESNYGKGWKEGTGKGSHNWGAVQTANKKDPQFSHQDSSAKGKYITGFKAYPDDIAGAADVVRNLFKANGKQRKPDPNNAYRATGATINGPGRSELIREAIQSGDTNAFSRAMWYTSYFEGTAPVFAERIKVHANAIQRKIDSISSALGEPAAWSQKSPENFRPVTNDRTANQSINTPAVQNTQQSFNTAFPQTQQQQPSDAGLEGLLWFQ